MSRFSLALALAAILGLTGCASGLAPRAKPPAGATAPFVAAESTSVSTVAPSATWWRLFDAPELDALIAEAFTANRDVAVARANLRRARAFTWEARAARLPSTQISGSATRGRQSAAALGGSTAFDESNVYDAGIDVAYELDLFGAAGRSISSARAGARSEKATLDDVLVTVASETARAYVDVCAAQRQLDVARQTLDLQTRSFALTQKRAELGRDDPQIVAQSRALLAQTEASLPQFEAARAEARFRLATLVGRTPSAAPVATCTMAPEVTTLIPVGDGAMLLARRPDIRAARARLEGTSARVGLAWTQLLPIVQLTGSFGSTALDRGDFGSDAALRWSAGPFVTWAFPNVLAASARVAQAKADDRAALARYEGVVLTALQETETALSNYARALERRQALIRARDESREAARIVQVRYDVGRGSFLDLLDAQRSLAGAEAALASSQADVARAQVTVFKSLGGGWNATPPSNGAIAQTSQR